MSEACRATIGTLRAATGPGWPPRGVPEGRRDERGCRANPDTAGRTCGAAGPRGVPEGRVPTAPGPPAAPATGSTEPPATRHRGHAGPARASVVGVPVRGRVPVRRGLRVSRPARHPRWLVDQLPVGMAQQDFFVRFVEHLPGTRVHPAGRRRPGGARGGRDGDPGADVAGPGRMDRGGLGGRVAARGPAAADRPRRPRGPWPAVGPRTVSVSSCRCCPAGPATIDDGGGVWREGEAPERRRLGADRGRRHRTPDGPGVRGPAARRGARARAGGALGGRPARPVDRGGRPMTRDPTPGPSADDPT